MNLARDVVDVCVVGLDRLPPELPERLAAACTDEERRRAVRLPSAAAGRQTLLARGVLRTVLAERVRRPPRSLELVRDSGGKPALADGEHAFNLSHSGEVVVVAVATRPVGVDVERHHPDLDVDAVVRRFFPPDEAAELLRLAPAERRRRFFRSWCRKEALLKAEGSGLRAPLHLLPPLPEPEARRPRPVPGFPRWHVVDLDVAPAFSCALVAEGADWVPAVRPWPDTAAAPVPAVRPRPDTRSAPVPTVRPLPDVSPAALTASV